MQGCDTRREVFQVLTAAELPINASFAGKQSTKTAAHIVGLLDDIEAIDVCSGRVGSSKVQSIRMCGFACAIRTQQTEDLAALDLRLTPLTAVKWLLVLSWQEFRLRVGVSAISVLSPVPGLQGTS